MAIGKQYCENEQAPALVREQTSLDGLKGLALGDGPRAILKPPGTVV
jgi:hypothetical protein